MHNCHVEVHRRRTGTKETSRIVYVAYKHDVYSGYHKYRGAEYYMKNCWGLFKSFIIQRYICIVF